MKCFVVLFVFGFMIFASEGLININKESKQNSSHLSLPESNRSIRSYGITYTNTNKSEIIKTKNKDDSKLLYKKAAGSKIMLIRNEKNKDVMKREESPVLDLNKLEELALKNHEPIGLKKELERLGDVLSVGLGNEKKSDKTESNDQEPVSTFDLKSGKKFNSFQKSMFYKVSRFLVNLSKNVKIGAPCCPDGHCCPYKYYDKI